MKKSRRFKSRKRKSIKHPSLPKESIINSFYYGFGTTGVRGYIQLFVAIFMVIFIGSHLIEAAKEYYIINLRVVSKVYFTDAPLWFIFVVIFKILLLIISLGYIWYYIISRIKRR